MARVLIDVSVVGQSWFADIVNELLKSKSVRFAYTDHPLFSEEMNKSRKMLELHQLAGKLNRRDDISAAACDIHVQTLSAEPVWESEEACDDPHIFAINYLKPVAYVFTHDTRIAKCRDCINGTLDSKYAGFSLVANRNNYDQNRHYIHAQ
jgi:hypothetical protein